MKLIEKIILILTAVAGVAYGVFKLFRLYGISYCMLATFVLVIALGIYYIITTKKELATVVLIGLLLFPIGVLFRLNHWPGASPSLIIGVYGHLVAGIFLIIKYKFKPLSLINKVAFSLLVVSLILTVILLYTPQVYFGVNLATLSRNIIFLSGMQLLVTNVDEASPSVTQKIIVLSVAISFMPFVSWVVSILYVNLIL